MSNNQLEDIKIQSVRSESKQYKIKSYVTFLILIVIVFAFFLFLGSFGNDMFGLLVFLIIFSLPVIIIFRNSLPKILPDFIADSVYEIDNTTDSQKIYNISTKTTQSGLLFGIAVLLIGAIALIVKYRKQIEDPMCFFKIMGSMVCLSFAGIMLSKVTGEELSILDDEELEAQDQDPTQEDD